MWKRLFSFTAALALLASPAHAFTVSKQWYYVFGDGTFPTFSNSIDIGFYKPSHACGSFTSGGLIVLTLLVDGSSGDPASSGFPAITGFTKKWDVLSSNGTTRVAKFTKVSDGTETCASGHFHATWTDATPAAVAYAIGFYADNGGTPPATRVDSADAAEYRDNTIGGVMPAPSTSPSATGDLLESTYAVNDNRSNTYAGDTGQTTVANSVVDGGAFFGAEILITTETLSASGATGARTGSYNNSFDYQVNGNMTIEQPTSGGGGGGNREGMLRIGAGH